MHPLPLACPDCRSALEDATNERIRCISCGKDWPIVAGSYHFVDSSKHAAHDPLDRLKSRFKRFPRFYRFVTWLVSPIYFDATRRRFLREHVIGRDGLFLNLGSGNVTLDPAVLNVDATPYDNVRIVTDITRLPFCDHSVDGVLSISVLEHVSDPEAVLQEIRRILRPGGFVYTDVPFVVGYHASPEDFHRWTADGVRHLHEGFDERALIPNGGPTSALLWIFQEWIAVTLSFGSRRLHAIVLTGVMLLTFPIKFLDIFLKHLPTATRMSSCFIYIGRKR
jgi:SAM-dependent methyltransferase